MHPAYFETRFKLGLPAGDLPDDFAIVTAYQTAGKEWPIERNQEARKMLQAELEQGGVLVGTMTGYSPRTSHTEPGFAALLSFEQACDLGLRYEQDAIYFVSGGTLFVSLCDHRRALKPVTRLLDRMDDAPLIRQDTAWRLVKLCFPSAAAYRHSSPITLHTASKPYHPSILNAWPRRCTILPKPQRDPFKGKSTHDCPATCTLSFA
jgi:hypothetical protein